MSPSIDEADDLAAILDGFAGRRLWVVGDVMLDEYVEGDVQRISPEAPVPVVAVRQSWTRLGGAANVARCLAALGAHVRLVGVVGRDAAGDEVREACAAGGIDATLVHVGDRATIRKLRVVAQHQQLLRLDWERGPRCPARSCGS